MLVWYTTVQYCIVNYLSFNILNFYNWIDCSEQYTWSSSVLWNAMIHPLLNMTLTGAIWYQGSTFRMFLYSSYTMFLYSSYTMCKHLLIYLFFLTSGETNANYNRDKYNCTFPGMIDDWRMAFHEGSEGQTALDFPFGFVQVPLNSQYWIKNVFIV